MTAALVTMAVITTTAVTAAFIAADVASFIPDLSEVSYRHEHETISIAENWPTTEDDPPVAAGYQTIAIVDTRSPARNPSGTRFKRHARGI